ncbi:hypothetical protein HAZT_HAZT001759 [Hyalella azteca]|uniref:Uncharacterized protein n=1 Tax=Hyalella azteca TaxID=294128 RepID=A0A6A0GQF6_HYAAZ|nr:hypothetical protein HAZT_HAZT001759 [Hyalella azteca]
MLASSRSALASARQCRQMSHASNKLSVWDKLFDINVKSTWALTKLVAPHMQKKKKGSIIYALSGYIVSKSCLLAMSKMVAQQLAPDNVRVNCLLPGLFKTRFGEVIEPPENFQGRRASRGGRYGRLLGLGRRVLHHRGKLRGWWRHAV